VSSSVCLSVRAPPWEREVEDEMQWLLVWSPRSALPRVRDLHIDYCSMRLPVRS
jgi:hypothetical protein